MQHKKTLDHNFLDKLMCILLLYQMESYAQVHEPVIMSQIFFMSVHDAMKIFLRVLFHQVAFVIEILSNTSLFVSILMYNINNLGEINKIGCSCDNNSNLTMIISSLLQHGIQ